MTERFPKGTRVKVRGLPGEYHVCYFNKDGSVTIYGGHSDREGFHAVVVDRLIRRRVQQ